MLTRVWPGTMRPDWTVTVAGTEHQTNWESWRGADEGRLVEACLAGHREAFDIIVERHQRRVYQLCYRFVSNHEDASDLVQDVFVRAWQKLSLFRGDSAFSTWLHRLAVNVVLNARKSEGRQRRRFGADDAEEEDEFQVAVPAASTGEAIDLEAAIALLPPGARRVFVLHDVQGYKHEEIAEMLDITAGGSKAQLHRARMLLREALDR